MHKSDYLQPNTHICELDAIRGIACLLVVLLHCIFGLMTSADFQLPIIQSFISPFLASGVDLFFVLSGFLIGGILIDHKHSPNYFNVFWVRRAARILPVYLLLFFTYVIALNFREASAPWFKQWLMVDPIHPFWSYLTFMQNFFMAAANSPGPRWLGITWSLAVEEQFYLIFPFVIYFLSRRIVIGIAIATLCVAPVIRMILWKYNGFYAGYLPTPARADALMFGILIAYVVRDLRILAAAHKLRLIGDIAAILLVLILGKKLLLNIPETLHYTLRGVLFAYCILRIFISNGPYRLILRSKFLVFLGSISYPLYMYHQAINGLMHGYIFGQIPTINGWDGIVVGIAVVLIAGTMATLSTLYFERPFREMGKKCKYLQPRTPFSNVVAKPQTVITEP